MEIFEIWAIISSLVIIALPVTAFLKKLHKEHKELEELFLK